MSMKLFLKMKYLPAVLFVLLAAPIAHATAVPSLGAADPFAILTFTYGRNGNPGPTLTGDFGYTTTTGSSAVPTVSGATHVADSVYNQAVTDGQTAEVALRDYSNFPCAVTFPPVGNSVDLSAQDVGSGAGVFPPGIYCTSMATMNVTIGAAGITLDGQGTYIFRFGGAPLVTAPNSVVRLIHNASACDVFWLPSVFGATSILGGSSTFVGTVFSHGNLNVNDAVHWSGRALTVGSGTVSMASSDSIAVPVCNQPTPTPATLHVIKHVVNNDGGTATASSFTMHVKSSGGMGSNDVPGSPANGVESPGAAYSLVAGTYVVSEDVNSGYTQSFSGDCDASGHITLASGDNKTCTIINDDVAYIPPAPSLATLHVIKRVVNNDGGTATAASFMLHVKGSGGMGLTDVANSPASGVDAPGRTYGLVAGSYVVSEETNSGYAVTFSGDCDANGHINLAPGENKTCWLINDDNPGTVQPQATLHVIKVVINDDGGQAIVSDAIVHVMNGSGNVSGSPQHGVGSPGTAYTLNVGTYNVSEDFFPGYTVKVGGDCAENGNITLAKGDNKTCTITNNDIAGTTGTSGEPTPVVTPTPTPTAPIPAGCDVCSRLTYDVYIVNPDGTERHTGTDWVRMTDRGEGIRRYSFEDATIDPRNPLYDYNDSVVDVDYKDCKGTKFMFVSSDASWKHQVRIKVSIDGVTQSDTLVVDDSKAVVGTVKVLNATIGVNMRLACSAPPSTPTSGLTGSVGLKGRILLQVQQHGEAWYVHPGTGLRYYMKDGPVAYGMMRNFGLGITDQNLAAIPSVATVDELKSSSSVCSSNSMANKVKGWILLQVQQHGEAWYVDATKCRRIYMKDGAAAYTLMRFLGLGITDANLAKIKIGS
ncbi:MAG: ice-binding family protein [Patescibacteria group bacterium]|nr:ice-binding family protein [Patescibacteria group bacterium]